MDYFCYAAGSMHYFLVMILASSRIYYLKKRKYTRYYFIPVKVAAIKKTVTSVDKNMEKLEHSFIAGGI